MVTSGTWDDPDTARYYEQFCRRYARYRSANRKLVEKASIAGNQKILDFAAGTGRTAEAILGMLGSDGAVLCVEPSGAMRTAGIRRVRDSRVSWTVQIPCERESWDRVLCGAAIWQLESLQEWFFRFASILRPGGALCFNIPSLYLGEADEAGAGEDPLLLRLAALLSEKRTSLPPQAGPPLPTTSTIDGMLRTAGLIPERWDLSTRFSYAAYREWLKIPVNTEGLFAGKPADARAALIDEAFEMVDRHSWRWERWTGWTAWKKPEE